MVSVYSPQKVETGQSSFHSEKRNEWKLDGLAC